MRAKNIYNPKNLEPFKLSRSKLELFVECPRCFYLDRRQGVGRPAGFPFTLNSAVDHLLKKEFDLSRAKQEAHPLMKHYGLQAVPFAHENLNEWRENFVGVQVLHEPTNLLIFGAVDDIWQTKTGELLVVDYKATSTQKEITLEEEYRQSYKRQMEIYQWLLRQKGYQVSDTGYFVYCNGLTDKKAFDAKLEFDIILLPYTGSDVWVEQTIFDAWDCLKQAQAPKAAEDCPYCTYVREAGQFKALDERKF